MMFEIMSELKNVLSQCLQEISKTELRTQKVTQKKSVIAVWIPEDYKAEYDRLQDESNLVFGKLIQEMIKQAIDTAKNR